MLILQYKLTYRITKKQILWLKAWIRKFSGGTSRSSGPRKAYISENPDGISLLVPGFSD